MISSGFCNFQTIRQGCDTPVKGTKDSETSKISVKTENFVAEMLKLCVLPRPSRSPDFTETGPSHGRKN